MVLEKLEDHWTDVSIEKELFNSIVGKTLVGCYVSSSLCDLRLDFSDGYSHRVAVEGDCCSQSWWADIIGAKSALGGTVLSWHRLKMPPQEYPKDDSKKERKEFRKHLQRMKRNKSRFIDGTRSKQDVDISYGYSINTSKGSITLAFRCSSYGYYGGEAFVWDEEYEVYSWVEITTDDWSA